MKRLYDNLRNSNNHNIIIDAMLISLGFIVVAAVIGIADLFFCLFSGRADTSDSWFNHIFMWQLAMKGICILICIGTGVFIYFACRKNAKFIFIPVVILLALNICCYGVLPYFSHIGVLGICWYWLSQKENSDILKVAKFTVAGLLVFSLINIPFIVYYDFYGMDGLTAMGYVNSFAGAAAYFYICPEFFLALLVYRKTKKEGRPAKSFIRSIVTVWIIIIMSFIYSTLISYGVIGEGGRWEEWGPSNENSIVYDEGIEWEDGGPATEIEEGDWSKWETEE